MLSRAEVLAWLAQYPKFEDTVLGLPYAPRMPKAMVKETQEVIAVARKFNRDVARKLALPLDKKTHEDPGHMPWDLVEEANRWGFYTMWIPKLFGGKGCNMPSLSHFVEEIGSVCLGIANVIGVHYLGVAAVISSGNVRLSRRIMAEVAEGEQTGKPCLLALAITEPMAGTDVEEVELEDKGKVTCHARRVKGGYIVNGTKVFISMGHMSAWTVLYAFTDIKKPSESTVALMVKTGTKGFTFGTHENKMGQRACPASVLNFEECFIPDELVLFDSDKARKLTGKPLKDVNQRYIDYVVSATRPGVCAFGTGAARGAYEAALKYASTTQVGGRLLINNEWVQSMLAEMYKNVALGRLAYMEANNANSHRGMYQLLQVKPLYYYYKFMPESYFKNVLGSLLDKEFISTLMGRINFDWARPSDQDCCSGWASLAKFAGTDLGIRNCQLALELMGASGLRQDAGAEKVLRDAKLLQIYEGTNQLNRLNLFKCLIAPAVSQAKCFEE